MVPMLLKVGGSIGMKTRKIFMFNEVKYEKILRLTSSLIEDNLDREIKKT